MKAAYSVIALLLTTLVLSPLGLQTALAQTGFDDVRANLQRCLDGIKLPSNCAVAMTTECINSQIREKQRCETPATAQQSPIADRRNAAGNQQATQFRGERISLDMQNVDIRAVLEIIADFAGLNLVVDPSINFAVSMRWKDMPWDQALYNLATLYNLSATVKNGSIIVMKRQR